MATAVRPAVLSSVRTVVRTVPLALLLAGLSSAVVVPAAGAAEASVGERAVLSAGSAGAERGRSRSVAAGSEVAGLEGAGVEETRRPASRHWIAPTKEQASSWSSRPVVIGGTAVLHVDADPAVDPAADLAADLAADGTPPGSSGT